MRNILIFSLVYSSLDLICVRLILHRNNYQRTNIFNSYIIQLKLHKKTLKKLKPYSQPVYSLSPPSPKIKITFAETKACKIVGLENNLTPSTVPCISIVYTVHVNPILQLRFLGIEFREGLQFTVGVRSIRARSTSDGESRAFQRRSSYRQWKRPRAIRFEQVVL